MPQFPIQDSRRIFFIFLTAERGGEYHDLLYQSSISKYEDNLNITLFIFCMICNFLRLYSFVNNIYHIALYQLYYLSFATIII